MENSSMLKIEKGHQFYEALEKGLLLMSKDNNVSTKTISSILDEFEIYIKKK